MCHVLNIDYGILLGSTCMQGEEESEWAEGDVEQ